MLFKINFTVDSKAQPEKFIIHFLSSFLLKNDIINELQTENLI